MFEQRLFHTQKFHFLDFIILTYIENRKITERISENYIAKLKSNLASETISKTLFK